MNLDTDDIQKLEAMLEAKLQEERQQESTNNQGGRRVARFLIMTGVVVIIGFSGHIFHVEVIAKFGELVISCFYTFLMDEAQAGKGTEMLHKLAKSIRLKKVG